MPENRRVQRNAGVSNSSPNPSAHKLEESIRRLRIQTDVKDDGTAAAYPDRPGEPDCIFYLRTGMCGYGNDCRFNHPNHIGQVDQRGVQLPERVGEPDCVYFLKTGTCKYGSTCKYNHPRDRRGSGPIVLNMVGLPMRQEEKPCPHYVRTGSCKFGVVCKFHHPQPAVDRSNTPVPGPLPLMVPSSGINGVSPWPLPRATYISDPLLQTPQTYLPFLLPPSQGWNTYMSTGVFGGVGSIEQVYGLRPAAPHLPERPGEPECRYFVNTGNCKYGSDCKYHHPRAHFSADAVSLGPLGLPLRPGQGICSYYSLYGICKYGPTCKYDHPLVGYSYNYSPTFDPSIFSYAPESKSTKNPGWAAQSNGNLNGDANTPSSTPRSIISDGSEGLKNHSD